LEEDKIDPDSDSEMDFHCNREGYTLTGITGDGDMLRQHVDMLTKILCEKTDLSSPTSDWTLVKNANFYNAINMITIPTGVTSEMNTVFVTRPNQRWKTKMRFLSPLVVEL
jgi:hypothetical protein